MLKVFDGDGNGLSYPKELILQRSMKTAVGSQTKGWSHPGFMTAAGTSDYPGMDSLQTGPTNHCISMNERGDVLLLRAEELGNFFSCLY